MASGSHRAALDNNFRRVRIFVFAIALVGQADPQSEPFISKAAEVREDAYIPLGA